MKKWILRNVPAPVRYHYFRLKKKYKDGKLAKNYVGNTVECVLCKHQFTGFVPHRKRQNVRCLQCDSFDRDRLVYLYLLAQDFFNQSYSLLHVAPEKPLYEKLAKSPTLYYVPADLEPYTYPYHGRPRIKKVDITNIRYPNEFFDVILCNHVLEHVLEDRKAMRELFRVLKKGGWGIFQVPWDPTRASTYEDLSITDPKERERHFGQYNHVRWYGQDYLQRLEEVGFLVANIPFTSIFSKEELVRYGLREGEPIFRVAKA